MLMLLFSAKEEPEAGEQVFDVMIRPPPVVAVAVYAAVADGIPEVGVRAMLAGQVMVGGCALVTTMVKLQVDVLAALSVAVHCIHVVPMGNVEPDVTLQADVMIPDASEAE